MKTSEINKLKNSINKIEETPKTLLDLFKLVQNKEISPITDESDNIVGFNFSKGITGISVSKIVGGHLTTGATEEERANDEKNLKEFQEKFVKVFGNALVQQTIDFSYQLVAAGISPDDLIFTKCKFYYIVLKDKKIYNQSGEVVVDCSNITENLSNETLMRLLKAEFYANI